MLMRLVRRVVVVKAIQLQWRIGGAAEVGAREQPADCATRRDTHYTGMACSRAAHRSHSQARWVTPGAGERRQKEWRLHRQWDAPTHFRIR